MTRDDQMLLTIQKLTDQMYRARSNPELRAAIARLFAAGLDILHEDQEQGRNLARHEWEAKMRAMHLQGLTVRDMMDETGWAEGTVRTRLGRLGLRSNRETPVSEWKEKMRDMHGRGLNITEMARESGWALGTVRTRLSKLGLRAHRGRMR